MNRLTSNPALGNYTYGTGSTGSPLHGASSTSTGSAVYTASYDAVGDMTCRAPHRRANSLLTTPSDG